jgi:hypothetical protein
MKGERMTIPSDCDPLMAKIMTCCWATDPKDRPSFINIAAFIRDPNANLADLKRGSMPIPPPAKNYQDITEYQGIQ